MTRLIIPLLTLVLGIFSMSPAGAQEDGASPTPGTWLLGDIRAVLDGPPPAYRNSTTTWG